MRCAAVRCAAMLWGKLSLHRQHSESSAALIEMKRPPIDGISLSQVVPIQRKRKNGKKKSQTLGQPTSGNGMESNGMEARPTIRYHLSPREPRKPTARRSSTCQPPDVRSDGPISLAWQWQSRTGRWVGNPHSTLQLGSSPDHCVYSTVGVLLRRVWSTKHRMHRTCSAYTHWFRSMFMFIYRILTRTQDTRHGETLYIHQPHRIPSITSSRPFPCPSQVHIHMPSPSKHRHIDTSSSSLSASSSLKYPSPLPLLPKNRKKENQSQTQTLSTSSYIHKVSK